MGDTTSAYRRYKKALDCIQKEASAAVEAVLAIRRQVVEVGKLNATFVAVQVVTSSKSSNRSAARRNVTTEKESKDIEALDTPIVDDDELIEDDSEAFSDSEREEDLATSALSSPKTTTTIVPHRAAIVNGIAVKAEIVEPSISSGGGWSVYPITTSATAATMNDSASVASVSSSSSSIDQHGNGVKIAIINNNSTNNNDSSFPMFASFALPVPRAPRLSRRHRRDRRLIRLQRKRAQLQSRSNVPLDDTSPPPPLKSKSRPSTVKVEVTDSDDSITATTASLSSSFTKVTGSKNSLDDPIAMSSSGPAATVKALTRRGSRTPTTSALTALSIATPRVQRGIKLASLDKNNSTTTKVVTTPTGVVATIPMYARRTSVPNRTATPQTVSDSSDEPLTPQQLNELEVARTMIRYFH
jgi:hypothetical protein